MEPATGRWFRVLPALACLAAALGLGLGESLVLLAVDVPADAPLATRFLASLHALGFAGVAGLFLAPLALIAGLGPGGGLLAALFAGSPSDQPAGTRLLARTAAAGSSLAAGAACAWKVGMALPDMTSPFATAAVVLVSLAAALAALVATAHASALIERTLLALPPRLRPVSPAWSAALVALAAVAAARLASDRMGAAWTLPPAAAVTGGCLALALAPALHRPGRAAFLLAGVSVALAVAGLGTLGHFRESRDRLFEGSRFAGRLALAVRAQTDRDGDGFTRIWGGGDCDDDDAALSPAAVDLPGDDLDQNCDGLDSIAYAIPQALRSSERRPASVGPAPGVVVIVVDSLRASHMGIAGYERQTTPQLDALARSAAVFTDLRTSGPDTPLAFTSLLTGRYPIHAPREEKGRNFILQPAATTVSEVLKTAGVRTSALPMIWMLDHTRGFDQGFERFEPPWPRKDWRDFYAVDARVTTQVAMERLDELRAPGASPRGFFLLVHDQCVHHPYTPDGEAVFGKAPIDRYDACLQECDRWLAELVRNATEGPGASSTYVFLLGDHGEEFGEHGFETHGHGLFETALRAPLLVWGPGVEPRTVSGPVSMVDVGTTLFDLFDRPLPPTVEGISLLPFLFTTDRTPPVDRDLFFYASRKLNGSPRHQAAILRGTQKLVWHLESNSVRLFDLTSDPDERTDLAQERPESVRDLKARLDGWFFFGNEKGFLNLVGSQRQDEGPGDDSPSIPQAAPMSAPRL